MLLYNCTICGNKKSRLTKNKEASELLSKLGVKTQLSHILLISDILF